MLRGKAGVFLLFALVWKRSGWYHKPYTIAASDNTMLISASLMFDVHWVYGAFLLKDTLSLCLAVGPCDLSAFMGYWEVGKVSSLEWRLHSK